MSRTASDTGYSINEILMAAAVKLAADRSFFSAEMLTVTAWRESPKLFGLKGFADQYPDHHKVLACLCGGRGLVDRAWLSRVGIGQYSLTDAGREVAEHVIAGREVIQASINGHVPTNGKSKSNSKTCACGKHIKPRQDDPLVLTPRTVCHACEAAQQAPPDSGKPSRPGFMRLTCPKCSTPSDHPEHRRASLCQCPVCSVFLVSGRVG